MTVTTITLMAIIMATEHNTDLILRQSSEGFSAPRSPGGSVSGGANGRASSQTEHARALEEQIRLKKVSSIGLCL